MMRQVYFINYIIYTLEYNCLSYQYTIIQDNFLQQKVYIFYSRLRIKKTHGPTLGGSSSATYQHMRNFF